MGGIHTGGSMNIVNWNMVVKLTALIDNNGKEFSGEDLMTIEDYIHEFIAPDLPVLEAITAEQNARDDTRPNVGLDVGRLLGLLVRLLGAKRVLEFGTCLGYSAVWLADALRETDGHLTSIELDHALVVSARAYLQQAGLADHAEVLEGDAAEVVRTLDGPYDLILQDSAKSLYPEMLEDCIRLLRPGGVLAMDDALFKPMGIPEKFSAPVHRANQLAFADSRLHCTLLPIGDGLLLCVKQQQDAES
jgi:predicted O-methyltransferase YrrM